MIHYQYIMVISPCSVKQLIYFSYLLNELKVKTINRLIILDQSQNQLRTTSNILINNPTNYFNRSDKILLIIFLSLY